MTGCKPGFTDVTKTASAEALPATFSGPTPTITGTPVFGQNLTADVGNWGEGVTTHYTWRAGDTVLASDGPLTLGDPSLVGKTVTLAVAGSKPGYSTAVTTGLGHGAQGAR